MQKRYRVTLTESERQDLRTLVSTGKAAARKLVRPRILLLADQAESGPPKPIRRLSMPWAADAPPSSGFANNSSWKASTRP